MFSVVFCGACGRLCCSVVFCGALWYPAVSVVTWYCVVSCGVLYSVVSCHSLLCPMVWCSVLCYPMVSYMAAALFTWVGGSGVLLSDLVVLI